MIEWNACFFLDRNPPPFTILWSNLDGTYMFYDRRTSSFLKLTWDELMEIKK